MKLSLRGYDMNTNEPMLYIYLQPNCYDSSMKQCTISSVRLDANLVSHITSTHSTFL